MLSVLLEQLVHEVLLVVLVHLGLADSLEILDLQVCLALAVQTVSGVLEVVQVLLGLLVLQAHLVGGVALVLEDHQVLMEDLESMELLG